MIAETRPLLFKERWISTKEKGGVVQNFNSEEHPLLISRRGKSTARWIGEVKTLMLLLIFPVLFCTSNHLQAQDPYFSQNLYHTLYLNPAYTGYGAKMNVNLSYRNQWRYDNYPSYRSTYASIESKIICFNKSSYLAVGGFGLFDQEYLGAINNSNSQISVATSLKLSQSKHVEARLMLGIAGGLISRSYNINDPILFETIVTNGSNFDPALDVNIGFVGKSFVEDISVGSAIEISLKKRHFLLLGVSASHLTSPEIFVGDRVERKFGGNFLGSFAMKNRLSTKFYTDFAWQNKFLRSQTGFLIGLAPDFLNASTKDDFGFEAGATFGLVGDVNQAIALESIVPTIVINYMFIDVIISKDINISSREVSENRGGMEFTMQFKITRKEHLRKICNPSSIICPKF